MTSPDRFEQQLPELMAELAPARVPDYFDDLLRATARTRQRPAWSSLERWLPMDVALPSAGGRTGLLRGLAVIALVALLAAAVLVAYVGSRPHRVPAPFGLAANGSMYYPTAKGDVFALDSTTGTPRAILTGISADGVLPSRDGLRIATMSKVIGGEQLSVANADGTGRVVLPGTYTNFSEINWSPTDAQVAIVSEVAGISSISILEADGSKATPLTLGYEVHNFWYLPDGRFAFHGSPTTGAATFGLYTVNADGTNIQPIVAPAAVDNWLSMNPSDDGTRIVYHKWVDDPLEHGRLHVIDLASGKDTTVQVAGTLSSDIFEEATFAPDGKSILFKWFTADGNVRLAVVPAGGGTATLMGPPVPHDVSPDALFSPDGHSVIARYPSLDQVWLLDPTGGKAGGDRQLSLAASDVPTWQRVAP
jgi:hypothetical protein